MAPLQCTFYDLGARGPVVILGPSEGVALPGSHFEPADGLRLAVVGGRAFRQSSRGRNCGLLQTGRTLGTYSVGTTAPEPMNACALSATPNTCDDIADIDTKRTMIFLMSLQSGGAVTVTQSSQPVKQASRPQGGITSSATAATPATPDRHSQGSTGLHRHLAAATPDPAPGLRPPPDRG